MVRPKLASLAFFCAFACVSASVARAADSCRFQFLPARPGDISSQDLDFLIDLKLTVAHGDGDLFRSQKSVERLQTRWTTVLEVDRDVVTAVAVRYDVASETQLTDNKAAKATNEPVAGKTYHIARQGETLTITNLDGKTPTKPELEYLAKSMDSVGRPNTLARYMHNREMTVGKTIDIPKEISAEIFGFRDAIGEVASLQLTLREVHRTSSGNYAILDAKMLAHSPEQGPGDPKLSMRIEGMMQVEIDTCRLVGFVWEGPVTLTEKQGEGAQTMTLNGLGTVAVEMRAKRAAAWPKLPADYAASPSSSKSRK